jgi:hypothetical protein
METLHSVNILFWLQRTADFVISRTISGGSRCRFFLEPCPEQSHFQEDNIQGAQCRDRNAWLTPQHAAHRTVLFRSPSHLKRVCTSSVLHDVRWQVPEDGAIRRPGTAWLTVGGQMFAGRTWSTWRDGCGVCGDSTHSCRLRPLPPA